MTIISKRKKAYSVVYKRDEKTIEETYYDRKLVQKRKEQIVLFLKCSIVSFTIINFHKVFVFF